MPPPLPTPSNRSTETSIVDETYIPGMTIELVAQRHAITPTQISAGAGAT
jgi:hypothetical protein